VDLSNLNASATAGLLRRGVRFVVFIIYELDVPGRRFQIKLPNSQVIRARYLHEFSAEQKGTPKQKVR
jgi:hypothetical protein